MSKCHQSGFGQRNRRSGEKAEILILDDIGGETDVSLGARMKFTGDSATPMQENLPTFFTSNFNFEELERHFAVSRMEMKTWQAKRVMERGKF